MTCGEMIRRLHYARRLYLDSLITNNNRIGVLFTQFAVQFRSATLTLTIEMQQKISNWITKHIKQVDMKLGKFLQDKV